MITVTVNTEEHKRMLAGKAGQVYAAVTKKMNALFFKLQGKIVGNLAGGNPIQSRTGMGGLAGSVQVAPAKKSGEIVSGEVIGAGGAQWYGIVHEYGGTRSYTIVPTTKNALAFMAGGKQVVVKAVNHPPLKARPWFNPVYESMKPEFEYGISEAVGQGLK